MGTFWERAAHSVYRMFSLYFDIVILVISHFGVEGGTLVGLCLSFTFYINGIELTLTFLQQIQLWSSMYVYGENC